MLIAVSAVVCLSMLYYAMQLYGSWQLLTAL
jgi:hypothetical protein